jgi:hypothetical protein
MSQVNADNQQLLTQMLASDSKLMNDLNTFNAKYAKYIKCNDIATISTTCNPTDLNCCTSADKNIKNVLDSQKILNDDIDAINKLITGNKDKLISHSAYDASFNHILKQEVEIKRLRSELDIKLRQIYKIDNTLIPDTLSQSDSVLYTGILFTILATTALYFTFTKL